MMTFRRRDRHPDHPGSRMRSRAPPYNTSTLITSEPIKFAFDSCYVTHFYFAASWICTNTYHFMIVVVLLSYYRNIKEQFSDVLRSKYHFERKWRRMESNHPLRNPAPPDIARITGYLEVICRSDSRSELRNVFDVARIELARSTRTSLSSTVVR